MNPSRLLDYYLVLMSEKGHGRDLTLVASDRRLLMGWLIVRNWMSGIVYHPKLIGKVEGNDSKPPTESTGIGSTLAAV
ncbi:MAG TPA: hypothetical protein VK255_02320 [Patescibacteria group bacterium]|nr:hypothetical protein [Patescibacteria group bacterium]